MKGALETQVFQEELDRLEPAEQETVMQIVTSWMEQGLEQGIERERSLILRQLTLKVGTLAEAARSRVDALTITQLEALGEAPLAFSSLFDLEAWLIANAGE